ncbi:MAG TPA: Rho termination factor N-terminal domain-containing protein, partial [Candidatus Rifleibacterium sp.]|nr:Rho termination factor N-terminal domain-containing protein [Candidatus Rifleibacterium sp.]
MKTRFTEKKLASLTRQELYTLARELDIAGRSSLSRQELIKVLQLLLVEPPVSRGLKKAPLLPAIVKSQEQPGQTYTRDSSTEEAPPPKRGRGRPTKKTAVESQTPALLAEPPAPEKSGERRRPGRPP